MTSRNRYQEPMHDGRPHPLKDVPNEVLEVARCVLEKAADWNDVHPELVVALADSVVMALVEAGYVTWTETEQKIKRNG